MLPKRDGVLPIRDEILDCTRACERLLSTEITLTAEERDLLEYYVKELSRELLSAQPTLRLRSPSEHQVEAQSQSPT